MIQIIAYPVLKIQNVKGQKLFQIQGIGEMQIHLTKFLNAILNMHASGEM
jgi:hypothetical protein